MYNVDLEDLTVIRTHKGEHHDLNSSGAPCRNLSDLKEFISELYEQGAFDEATRDELLSACRA